MANQDIFLGSGASITFIPENDIFIGGRKNDNSAFNGSGTGFGSSTNKVRVDNSFGNLLLVNNLYKGCLLEFYNSSNALQSTHRIVSNTEEDIEFTPTLDSIAANSYFVIKSYGAPVPAPKDGSTKRLLSDQFYGLIAKRC